MTNLRKSMAVAFIVVLTLAGCSENYDQPSPSDLQSDSQVEQYSPSKIATDDGIEYDEDGYSNPEVDSDGVIRIKNRNAELLLENATYEDLTERDIYMLAEYDSYFNYISGSLQAEFQLVNRQMNEADPEMESTFSYIKSLCNDYLSSNPPGFESADLQLLNSIDDQTRKLLNRVIEAIDLLQEGTSENDSEKIAAGVNAVLYTQFRYEVYSIGVFNEYAPRIYQGIGEA